MSNIGGMPQGSPGVNVDETLGSVLSAIHQVVDEVVDLVLVLAVTGQLIQDKVKTSQLVVPIKGSRVLILHAELTPQLLGLGHIAGIASSLC